MRHSLKYCLLWIMFSKRFERMEEEQDGIGYNTDYPTNRTVTDNELLAEEATAAQ